MGQDSDNNDISSAMAFIPPCWIKYSVYDNDDGDMVIDMWFSAAPQTGDGWMLHPAFIKSPAGILISRATVSQASSTNGNIPVSVIGTTGARVSNTVWDALGTTAQLYDEGLHIWNIYERMLLFDLIAAEYCTLDWNKISTRDGVNNTATSSSSWRGILGLFALYDGDNRGQYINGFLYADKNNSATQWESVYVEAPQMNGNKVKFNCSVVYGSTFSWRGWATEVLRGYDDILGFDVALLGIAKTVVYHSDTNIRNLFGMLPHKIITGSTVSTEHGVTGGKNLGLFGITPIGAGNGFSRLTKYLGG